MSARAAVSVVALALALGVGAAVAPADGHESLRLDAMTAFSEGTTINVESVAELRADSLEALLAPARARREWWARDPIALGVFVAGEGVSGRSRAVSARVDQVDGEWSWVRVVVEDEGYADDSIGGRRLVLWFERGRDGGVRLRRALAAQLCQRVHWRYYSDRACP